MSVQLQSIPQCGIDLIKKFQGYMEELADGRSQAYPDPIHGWEVPSIGFGTTRYPDGSKVKKGDIITRNEAEKYLTWEIEKVCQPALEKIPTWKKMNSNQQGALYSFAYNLGANFYGSKNFHSITKVCNKVSRWEEKSWVMKQFKKYHNSGSADKKDLRRRRAAEAELFCTPIDNRHLQKSGLNSSSTMVINSSSEIPSPRFPDEKILDFVKYFDWDNGNHINSFLTLASALPYELYNDNAEWVKIYRTPDGYVHLNATYYSQRDNDRDPSVRLVGLKASQS